MGSVDRVVRVTIAFVIISLYVSGAIPGTLGIVLIALSGIFVVTSLVGVCPLYSPWALQHCERSWQVSTRIFHHRNRAE